MDMIHYRRDVVHLGRTPGEFSKCPIVTLLINRPSLLLNSTAGCPSLQVHLQSRNTARAGFGKSGEVSDGWATEGLYLQLRTLNFLYGTWNLKALIIWKAELQQKLWALHYGLQLRPCLAEKDEYRK